MSGFCTLPHICGWIDGLINWSMIGWCWIRWLPDQREGTNKEIWETINQWVSESVSQLRRVLLEMVAHLKWNQGKSQILNAKNINLRCSSQHLGNDFLHSNQIGEKCDTGRRQFLNDQIGQSLHQYSFSGHRIKVLSLRYVKCIHENV